MIDSKMADYDLVEEQEGSPRECLKLATPLGLSCQRRVVGDSHG